MKKILSYLLIAMLALSIMPAILADGADDSGGIGVIVDDPVEENVCPMIYQDHTQRSWYPNDQTIYTATEYGVADTNVYGEPVFDVEDRGNYVFQGETVAYYVIVEDENGDDDIEAVRLNGFGACLEIDPSVDYQGTDDWAPYASSKFGVSWDADTMNLYQCKLIVGSETGLRDIVVEARDGLEDGCTLVTDEKEALRFNPTLTVQLDGSIDFGNVLPGDVATSNPIKVRNVGSQGVVMDLYIASEDYFVATGPGHENAICGDGNGIKYDRFSYYATKGSLDSGDNDNAHPGLGETSGICSANEDEYTPMPSHSGEIGDMCRIINHLEEGSFLNQGDFMSLKLRLDVPSNCEPYAYTDGEFHVVGRVV
jgi:hypothetical protein